MGRPDAKSSFRIPILPASVLSVCYRCFLCRCQCFRVNKTHLAFVAHLSLSNLFPLLIPLRTCNKHTSATLPPSPPPSLDEFLSEASGGAGSVYTRINTEMGGKCDIVVASVFRCVQRLIAAGLSRRIALGFSKKYSKRIPLGRVGNERMANFLGSTESAGTFVAGKGMM